MNDTYDYRDEYADGYAAGLADGRELAEGGKDFSVEGFTSQNLMDLSWLLDHGITITEAIAFTRRTKGN